ncbi:hypothetical protein B0H11DRAFT_186871 [Mycena galericulata]|nr:hypothetical protein B0H11DRAFT_186871 [Mycena galericulata]
MAAHTGPSSTENRVRDLWFSDGSLVVRAEEKLFRVSGAVLAARSSVFQDMLSFPQPGPEVSPTERVENIPTVELHDKAVEVEPFLRAIFDSSFFMPPPLTVELSDALAILRLSHKYDIQYLHLRALDHLVRVYPTQLATFLAELNTLPDGFTQLRSSASANLDALCVLHEVNALWLLPAAYIRAARLNAPRFHAEPAWTRVPAPIRNTLHLAHAHQARHVMAIVHSAGREDPDRDCQTPHACAPLILAVLGVLLEYISEPNVEFNVFDVKDLFRPGVWDASFEATLCEVCSTRTAEQIEVGTQNVWDALPVSLMLPPWEDLRSMMVAVMG